ncbi:RagB/SusD family nutrient uptake outer membrane protein [Chitinophaga polysaccharea]|uniref:RagB/SusD family nutrient uptake outer membrane protein n=1 Tax=Chitinophaga polysaccharea TaxID=1293035 RepID=UPI001455164D|nr:RagB/SusD family nutrient uptake outer membrane protein [Chitinophaga polysaccharea]NLR58316.1 RagB/SusD family nutrient uptake outer membrane protein [Chitinophaga polysaccharea]
MANYKKNLVLLSCLLSVACSKSDFLDKKPNTNIVIPGTVADMIQLLDNQNIFRSNSASLGIMSGDEYYYASADVYNTLATKTEKNCYIWNQDIYNGEIAIPDWNLPYQSIYYCNAVLEQWDHLATEEKNSVPGQFVRGAALFFRGFSYYNLVSVFSPAYDESKKTTDLGVPLKESANINEVKQRATLGDTYNQVISDLTSSIGYFSGTFPLQHRNRPSKAAAYALLARVCLSMRNYAGAAKYADSSLSCYNKLIDYNTLDTTARYPLTIYNDELLLLNATAVYYGAVLTGSASLVSIDSNLINLFDDDDLRKPVFFRNETGTFIPKTVYAGSGSYPFTGLAVDEVYLVKAESDARTGRLNDAIAAMNTLLAKRYKAGTFTPITQQPPDQLLRSILLERRKELVWRGTRWTDLKRLNKEGANITLKRELDGKTFTLSPNDPKYVMPIPIDEIAISHIQQNIR